MERCSQPRSVGQDEKRLSESRIHDSDYLHCYQRFIVILSGKKGLGKRLIDESVMTCEIPDSR